MRGLIFLAIVVGIIAGIWNVFAAFSRFRMIDAVRARLPTVVAEHENITQLVVIGIINILLVIRFIKDPPYLVREKGKMDFAGLLFILS